MLQSIRNFKLSQALPRMLADFVLVHLCMVSALLAPVFYQLSGAKAYEAALRLDEVKQYYFPSFLLLSFLFPLVFLGHGFYTRSRGYAGRYKMAVVVQGTGMSILFFLAANFLFFRKSLVPRSALLTFCLLAMPALALARLAKTFIEARYEIKPRNGKAPGHSDGAVLVLGGAGYLGSVLVRKLLDSGRKVRVMDSLIYGDASLRGIRNRPNLEVKAGDCRNIQDMVAAVKGMESIVHLAAIVGDPACELDRQTALEINYAATRMLIEVAKGNGINRLIFASSCSVYGATDAVMDEHSSVQPISLYGQTKVDSEQALLLARSDNFHPTILRLATVFGLSYRPRFDLVVNLLTAKAYTEGVITIFNGEQWRPFIHISDVADGMLRVLGAPLPVVSGQVFNLGDTQLNCTLSQVAEKILAIFPDTRVEFVENTDQRNYRVSFDKIRHQLGFRASLGLEDGIRELRRAFEEKKVLDYTDVRYYNQKFLKASGSPSPKDVLDAHVMAAFAKAPTGNRGPTLLPRAAGRGS